MNKTILVTYASKHGATAEIAKKIGETLTQAGFQTALAEANTVRDLSPYQAIILGSAVYFGSWRKEAVKLLKANQHILAEKPTWFFSSGPAGEGDPVDLLDGWRFPSRQQEIADRIQPRDITVFHGALDPDKLNFFEKWILNNIKSPVGDFRDWGAITAWANSIADELKELYQG
jgi:menaquinone-dependent protoporphyrinogen oxidase